MLYFLNSVASNTFQFLPFCLLAHHHCVANCHLPQLYQLQGPRRGRGWGALAPPLFWKNEIKLTENNLTKITEPKIAKEIVNSKVTRVTGKDKRADKYTELSITRYNYEIFFLLLLCILLLSQSARSPSFDQASRLFEHSNFKFC